MPKVQLAYSDATMNNMGGITLMSDAGGKHSWGQVWPPAQGRESDISNDLLASLLFVSWFNL